MKKNPKDFITPCPSTPNCVVSLYPEDSKHHVKPWRYNASREVVFQKLVEVLEDEKNGQIIDKTDRFIHAVFRIPIFGFLDDFKVFIDEDQSVVHFRSSSREGHHDLWVNRLRVSRIKRKLKKSGLDLS